MVYLWEFPNNYPPSLIGEYSSANVVDRFALKKGERIPGSIEPPVVEFNKATLLRLSKMKALASNTMVPIVNQEIAETLNELAPEDIQLVNAVVRAKDGDSHEYFLINVVNKIRGIDHKQSDYDLIPGSDKILSFNKLVYEGECLGNHQIARDEEYLSNLLISKNLSEKLLKTGSPGLAFYPPNDVV